MYVMTKIMVVVIMMMIIVIIPVTIIILLAAFAVFCRRRLRERLGTCSHAKVLWILGAHGDLSWLRLIFLLSFSLADRIPTGIPLRDETQGKSYVRYRSVAEHSIS